MNEIILDSSFLISFAKIKSLEIIVKVKSDFIMPEEVYSESVIEGEKKDIPDAVLIKRFISDNNIKIYKVHNDYLKNLALKINKILSKGDEAVLALALQKKANEILTDNEGLAKIGLSLGFKAGASPDILLKCFRSDIVDFRKFEMNIRNLVIENRLSSQVAEFYILEAEKYVKT